LFTQQPYRYRLDWGRRGVQQAVEQGNMLVIVDTLRFSTATITATHHGGLIYPCSLDEDAAALARRIGGEVAVSRGDAPDKGRFSLSPATYFNIEPGTKVVLASPNGATCSRYFQYPQAESRLPSVHADPFEGSIDIAPKDVKLRITWELVRSCRICRERNLLRLGYARERLCRSKINWRASSGIVAVAGSCGRRDLAPMSGTPRA